MALYKCLRAVSRLSALAPDGAGHQARRAIRACRFAEILLPLIEHGVPLGKSLEIQQFAAPAAILHGTQSGRDRGPANNLAAPYGGRRASAGAP